MLNKKQMISIVASLSSVWIATNVYAAQAPAAYVGGQLGWGNIHQDGFKGLSHSSSKDDGIAGRIYAGYQFNQYVAVEAGATKFSNMTSKGTIEGMRLKGTVKTYAADLVAKGILPLQNGISIYGKAGAAYLHEKAHASIAGFSSSETESKVLPTFGVGTSYDINSNLVADLSWNRIQKVGHSHGLNSTDLVAVGLGYSFS